jgi:NAD-dependent DNA ligase
MDLLAFRYTDARGQERTWRLENWKESGKYIEGVSTEDRKFRTFRKDRVNEYLDKAESLLIEPRPAPPPPPSNKPDVLFTGFPKPRRAELEAIASDCGMQVRKTVTQGLIYLCCGPNAGPKKIEGAREKGAFILFKDSFMLMLETGELIEETD